jgi:hypothetical protein
LIDENIDAIFNIKIGNQYYKNPAFFIDKNEVYFKKEKQKLAKKLLEIYERKIKKRHIVL